MVKGRQGAPTAGDEVLNFFWVGNHPATDLCNTEPVVDGEPVELLTDLDALVDWAQVAGVTTVDAAEITGHDRARTLDFVRRLRGALRAVLETPGTDARALHALNDVLSEQPGTLHVEATTATEPVSLVAPSPGARLRLDVAAAAVDVFRADRRSVRRCANPECVLLFLDVSKSGRRRWCDMATCGNRAKVAAHYRRTKRH